mmetsp:Transcript_57637/g.150150  ORF Transcript_57637/g.150150 Transcript_57637/m.150150 type:complete len:220 (-) Transcript_57637:282-941(-)
MLRPPPPLASAQPPPSATVASCSQASLPSPDLPPRLSGCRPNHPGGGGHRRRASSPGGHGGHGCGYGCSWEIGLAPAGHRSSAWGRGRGCHHADGHRHRRHRHLRHQLHLLCLTIVTLALTIGMPGGLLGRRLGAACTPAGGARSRPRCRLIATLVLPTRQQAGLIPRRTGAATMRGRAAQRPGRSAPFGAIPTSSPSTRWTMTRARPTASTVMGTSTS